MGRRAIRKIDPNVDLSRHLKSFDELPRPCSCRALFRNDASLEVEVGSGKGLFLLGASQARPECNFLGIEVVERYAEFCAVRLAKRDIRNAAVVAADAGRVFGELIADAALCAVHVYFPDPWWKARHKKRRVMTAEFVQQIERALAPCGRLHFWTDVEEYFHATLDLVAKHTDLGGPFEVPERAAEHDMDYRTNFERRVRQLGKSVYRAEYAKRAGS